MSELRERIDAERDRHDEMVAALEQNTPRWAHINDAQEQYNAAREATDGAVERIEALAGRTEEALAVLNRYVLTAEELNALRYPIAPGNHTKHLAALAKLGWQEPEGNDRDGERTVFYGPHPCERCGQSIIRAGAKHGGTEYDAPEGPIYPNTYWRWHDCPARETPAPHPVRPHTPGPAFPFSDGPTPEATNG